MFIPQCIQLNGRSYTTVVMESPTLKTLLQLQLASDTAAVLHLPYILSCLSPASFHESEYTSRWTSRISSLLYSKDPAARWAGLCIAQRTAVSSRTLMLESAQSWVTIALPLLSVRMSCLSGSTSITYALYLKL